MQIELTGCTSAGKSTLAGHILQACRGQGDDFLLGDEFVLNQVGLNGVKHPLARTLLMDLISVLTCLLTWSAHREFGAFAIRLILKLQVGGFEKLNMARNTLKRIGIYAIIQRRSSEDQVVLVDEGTLHIAHNLFVHVSAQTDANDVMIFSRLAPLPDVAIYVRQPQSVLIERTLARGHKRIPDHSQANVERFVERAVNVFETLAQQPRLAERLLVFDGQHGSIVAPDCHSASMVRTLIALRSGVETVAAHDLPRVAPISEVKDSHVAWY